MGEEWERTEPPQGTKEKDLTNTKNLSLFAKRVCRPSNLHYALTGKLAGFKSGSSLETLQFPFPFRAVGLLMFLGLLWSFGEDSD